MHVKPKFNSEICARLDEVLVDLCFSHGFIIFLQEHNFDK